MPRPHPRRRAGHEPPAARTRAGLPTLRGDDRPGLRRAHHLGVISRARRPSESHHARHPASSGTGARQADAFSGPRPCHSCSIPRISRAQSNSIDPGGNTARSSKKLDRTADGQRLDLPAVAPQFQPLESAAGRASPSSPATPPGRTPTPPRATRTPTPPATRGDPPLDQHMARHAVVAVAGPPGAAVRLADREARVVSACRGTAARPPGC